MKTNQDIAEFLFKDITDTVTSLEERYPSRNLKEGQEVTRFAPSPTGFLHTGSLFTSMIGKKIASDSNGIFYTRLEDTDTKREIEGSGETLINQLHFFGLDPDEGYMGKTCKGNYGPYIQSERASIYKTVIKDMLIKGLAYVCFCSSEKLEEIRKFQEDNKLLPGYYGKFAVCRNLNNDEVYQNLVENKPYVIRFKSPGNHENKITVHDEIRGELSIAENDQDIVIYKSDGLPTYHFAHVVDDHFMRTTLVTRGEEWISSLPIHVQLFSALGFALPKYAHLPVIMKDEDGKKRKLSKRKDPEASVDYFIKAGYPHEVLLTYLMTIANSNYEEWMIENKTLTYEGFTFSLDKMSLDGALFDNEKLNFYSKEILSKLTASSLLERVKEWANSYDKEVLSYIEKDENYFEKILNIEREKENPRKDYAKYSDIFPLISFFYEDKYKLACSSISFNPTFSKEDIKEVLLSLRDNMDYSGDEQTWFSSLKAVGEKLNYAPSGKLVKKNPGMYKGHVGDVAEMLRIALTTSKQSPNLYYVIQVLGKEETIKRINFIVNNL